jgi:hypothetical protein
MEQLEDLAFARGNEDVEPEAAGRVAATEQSSGAGAVGHGAHPVPLISRIPEWAMHSKFAAASVDPPYSR